MILQLKIGDDNTIRFILKDKSNAIVPLTGGTLSLKIAKNIGVSNINATYYGEFTSFTDPTNGIHDEVIPDSTSATWLEGQYKIQARFVDSAGIVVSNNIAQCKIVRNLIDDE